jgi:hypothetical protein
MASTTSQLTDYQTTINHLAAIALLLSPYPSLSSSTSHRLAALPLPSTSTTSTVYGTKLRDIEQWKKSNEELQCGRCRAILIGGISASFVLSERSTRRSRRRLRSLSVEIDNVSPREKEGRERKRRSGWKCDYCDNILWTGSDTTIMTEEEGGEDDVKPVEMTVEDTGSPLNSIHAPGRSNSVATPQLLAPSHCVPSVSPHPITTAKTSASTTPSKSIPDKSNKKRRSKQSSGLAQLLEQRRQKDATQSKDGSTSIGLADFLQTI